jgi:hypothetical protein
MPESVTGRLPAGLAMLLMLSMALLTPAAQAVVVNVVDNDGAAVSGFRWLLQEDTTYEVIPGAQDPFSPALRLHTSYAPVVTSGHEAGSSADIALEAGKRYFISVLPDSGHSMSGAPATAAQAEVTVAVSAHPIPTAQISVFVFEDTQPLNNWPEPPAERGLAEFQVIVIDAGGRFGMAGGQMMTDAFGNMLGTTYDEDGNPVTMGNGSFRTGEDGSVRIKNLPPGKFTIQVIPPAGEGWVQTNTIEGGKGIDAWIRPNEPPFWREFAPNFYHTHFGFIRPTNDASVLTGGSTIKGQVVNLHLSRHPDPTFNAGHPWAGAWVGLNIGQRAVYAQPCDDEGNFSIPNVPPGSYQLVVFDKNLDLIIGFQSVVVPAGGGVVDLGQVQEFDWFGHLWQFVFEDHDEDGFPDEGEPGLVDVPTNIRWADGTIYQSFPTDVFGTAPYDEIFPFFHWQIAEVGFTRSKATGVTVVVDGGGAVLPDQGWDYPSLDRLTPQEQHNEDGSPAINPHTGNNLSRTEAGPALLEAFQIFQGQTSALYWGKSTYDVVDVNVDPPDDFPGPGDIDYNGNGLFDANNGGISGIVFYATTRAENDPRLAAAEPWEPGIPRVQVVLYQDSDGDTFIDDLDNSGDVTLADVDNYPFDWSDPAPGQAPVKGPEDVNRTGDPNTFDWGDALNVTHTDSWDDNLPTGAQGPPFSMYGQPIDCYDGLRNWNQVRPGVFDGGYAFMSYFRRTAEHEVGPEVPGLPVGTYIVEAVTPPGYEQVKEEDKNVDFGDEYQPETTAKSGLLLPALCVGDERLIPPGTELSLFPGVPCEFAGQTRRLPDRKQVGLSAQQNAAADFFFFTPVPVAGMVSGMLLDDVANERDPLAPTFGEKYAPPWIPMSIRDWTGQEVTRTYADEWGKYNFLVPSTYTANIPIPSGMAPNMLTVVLNSPGPILDTRPGSPTQGQMITDPYFNRKYGQIGLTFQFMPGTTTFLDTPIVRIGAFPNLDTFPVDVELPDGTPVIWSVENGPYADTTGQIIRIVSAGDVEVNNPFFDGTAGTQPKTTRDYGFGANPGAVLINGTPLTNLSWTNDVIEGTIAGGTTTGQLNVYRSNGKSTVTGITFTIGLPEGKMVHRVNPNPAVGATPIQDAVDAAQPGDLILVAPGEYEELVILWKPVQLQGWGAGSTTIDAVRNIGSKLADWKSKLEGLVLTGAIELLPGQVFNFDEVAPGSFNAEEGPGILVVARNAAPASGGFGAVHSPRIDGFTISGADVGGGICVNGYARDLQISNNRVIANRGTYGGGIRVGHPNLAVAMQGGLVYDSGRNDNIRIANNLVIGNGSTGGVGGGIALYAGANNYVVENNYVAGNYTSGNGAGIGHQGLSDNGKILRNKILFNQAFNQGIGSRGAGLLIAGSPPLTLDGLTPGAGSVLVDGNLIQGNLAGSGDGGGLRLEAINGADVVASPNNPEAWHVIDLTNNIITNNIAGLGGGGISMQDALRVNIIHNTIARNDSSASGGDAFGADPNLSTPQPAGIVSYGHGPALAAALGPNAAVNPYRQFSNPLLVNSIVWQNRSLQFVNDINMTPPTFLRLATPLYTDLAVVGTATPLLMTPQYCLLTSILGYEGHLNVAGNPGFNSAYYNGAPGSNIGAPGMPPLMEVAAASDEGGNFVDVNFSPLTTVNPATGQPYGEYRLLPISQAVDKGSLAILAALGTLSRDYDNHTRPVGGADIGADEAYGHGGGGDPTNQAPVAINDQFTVTMVLLPAVRSIAAPGVLANDADPEGDPITAQLVSGASRGVVSLNANGSFTYTPFPLFTGTDRFTYQVSDGSNTSNTATVVINVRLNGNRRPVAVTDSYSVEAGRTLMVPAPGVILNDSDPDGDTLTARVTRNVQNGVLTLRVDGSFIYTPNSGYVGPDDFRYVVRDGVQDSNTVTAVLNVLAPAVEPPVAPAPYAAPIVTLMNRPGVTRVVSGDPNVFDTFTYEITSPPAHGTVILTTTGIVNYTPAPGYTGPDSMGVRVTDQGGLSGTTTIAITVRAMAMSEIPVVLQCPPDIDGIDTDGDGIVDNDNVCLHLGAGDGFTTMADGRVLYMFGFSDLTGVAPEHTFMAGELAAESPGPTIAVREGQKLYLNLTNVGMIVRPDLFDPHTVHFHGFPQAAPIYDGMPDGSIGINMGGTFTYFYQLVDPGTYMYHCHMEATEHMQMGMLANLYVTPKQDGTAYSYGGRTYTTFAYNDGDGSTGYDVQYPIQIGSFDPEFHDASSSVQPLPFALMKDTYAMLNGRGYPETVNPNPLPGPVENGGKPSQKVSSAIRATQGQRILLRLSNLNVTNVYTLASGIPMQVVAHDARLLRSATGENLYYQTNSLTLGSGVSYDAILDTSAVAPGTYLLYTTNLNFLSNNTEDFGGMMTEIVVE